MPETSPIPVRLADDLVDRLEKAAGRLGSNRAAVIRLCVETFLDYFEANGGVASLPPDWEQIMRHSDHRTRESRSATESSTEVRKLSSESALSVQSLAAKAAEKARRPGPVLPRKSKAASPSGKTAGQGAAGRGRPKHPPPTRDPVPK